MPTVVFKFFARQGTGRTDRQSGDYMLALGKNKNVCCTKIRWQLELYLVHTILEHE